MIDLKFNNNKDMLKMKLIFQILNQIPKINEKMMKKAKSQIKNN
jgi:hypothetical protein